MSLIRTQFKGSWLQLPHEDTTHTPFVDRVLGLLLRYREIEVES